MTFIELLAVPSPPPHRLVPPSPSLEQPCDDLLHLLPLALLASCRFARFATTLLLPLEASVVASVFSHLTGLRPVLLPSRARAGAIDI